MEPKSDPIVLATADLPAFQEHNYRRVFYTALGQNWLLTAKRGADGSVGYRLVHVRTGAQGPGYGTQGPLPLADVEAFLGNSVVA